MTTQYNPAEAALAVEAAYKPKLDVNERPMNDPINHPAHYQTESGLEAITVIEAFGFGFCLGNAFKYMARAGRKTPDRIVDLMKARWNIDREIQRLGGDKGA